MKNPFILACRSAVLMIPLALAACQPTAIPGALPAEADACGAAGMQGLIGQEASALAAMSLPTGSRIIRPGMALTMDYREDRLNIELDGAGRIIRVACG